MLNGAVFSITAWCFLIVITQQNPVLESSDDDVVKQCLNTPDGTYPVRNLTEYLVCKNNNGSLQSCFNNELYSPANRSCLPLKFMTEATFCKERPTGDWANPWDCTKYFHCYFNWSEINSCESGKVYDAISDTCLHPALKGDDSVCQMPNVTSASELLNSTANHTETSNETVSAASQNNVTGTSNNTETSIVNGTSAGASQNNITGTSNHTDTSILNGTATGASQNNVTDTSNHTDISIINGTASGTSQNNITLRLNHTEISTTVNETAPEALSQGQSNNTSTLNQTEITTVNETTASNSSQTNSTTNDLISVADVQKRLASGDSEAIILIDVRMPWELKAEGKIGKSINIPLPDIETAFQLENNAFKAKYGINKPAKDNCNLVFHCKSGVRGQRAVDAVKDLGYTCPKNMDGGFNAWKTIYQK